MPSGIYKHKSEWIKILTKKFLIREYDKNKKSTYKIAKEVGCSDMAVYYWQKKFKTILSQLYF